MFKELTFLDCWELLNLSHHSSINDQLHCPFRSNLHWNCLPHNSFLIYWESSEERVNVQFPKSMFNSIFPDMPVDSNVNY